MDAVDETLAAIIFDWDGTAVPDRQADASGVRGLVEALCAAGVHVFVVSGTHVGNIDGQLRARPSGPGRLHLCLNRGSEVFEVGLDGPVLRERRTASPAEDAALDRAAALAVEALGEHGIEARLVSERLNRRKVDIIPLPEWADPPKARIGELLEAVTARLRSAGLDDLSRAVDVVSDAAERAGIEAPRITSDVKHVEVGLTDKSDSARWAARWLAAEGITGTLVLIAGDELGPLGGVTGSDAAMLVPELERARVVSVGAEPNGVPSGVRHLPGGPARFIEVLEEQVRRREQRRAPWVDEDPAWVVPLPDDPALERAAESIGALGNGRASLRAAREEDGAGSMPLFAVNGVFTDGKEPQLLPGPVWTNVELRGGRPDRRVLDLRTGVLVRASSSPARLRSLRLLSAARPQALALRAEADAEHLTAGDPFEHSDPDVAVGDHAGLPAAWSEAADGTTISVVARTEVADAGGRRVVERIGAWHVGPDPSLDRLAGELDVLAEVGFDGLLAEHRAAWARLWADAEVVIEGDTAAQLGARFAVFQLLACAAEGGEAAVGARGATGSAYGGHVFWDSDVYVLPVLAAIRPGAARAMLEYRVRRLGAARDAAERERRRGARFPWESAADGHDVTPLHARGPRGELIAIRTGPQEEHIVADVAWSACELAAWTGDDALLAGPGGDLVIETARYWASRARTDRDGTAHLYGVMGPDEYHSAVDDNAFTNVMARWNLRRAAALLDDRGGDASEARAWRHLAEALLDGWDPARGLYEQFAGYWDLEPLLATPLHPPVAADVVLGAARVERSQIIKQADVLMLHHLVPDEVHAGSLAPNLDFYGPRTAHGSSLSPAIHAALLARAGRPDEALEPFRLAARLDLDDTTRTTAGGLHLGALGGVWQALAYGFLGLRPRPGWLDVDPNLPAAWDALELRLRFHGARVSVRATPEAIAIGCDRTVMVRLADGEVRRCDPPGARFEGGLP